MNREEKDLIPHPRHIIHPHILYKNQIYPEKSLYTPHNSYDKLTQRNKTFDNAY
jgi:hypothetical protein